MSHKLWTPGSSSDMVMPAFARSQTAKRGMELVNLRELGILPGVGGGATLHGTHTAADIVTRTADGTDLNNIWNDFQALLNSVNGSRQSIINFLTFPVSQEVETVTQQGDGVDFEDATEFGEPVGARIAPSYFQMGYTFKWYDLAARYTWQYLADATAAMVDSVANAAVEAYWRKLLFEVFKTVFNATNLSANINGNAYNVYKFYNNDGTVPPTHKSNTFLSSHTHYRTSGAGTLVPADLDEIITDFDSHGYTMENGYTAVVMANTAVAVGMRQFRSTANGGTGTYDFIQSQGQPGTIITTTQQVIGQAQVANTLNGLNVIGSYGPLLIVQDDWMPTTHIFAFVTGGADSLSNPVGIRQHRNQGLRGLRLVKGRNPDYPLIDSFWNTGFGTGVRHRGAGMVMEITADASYDPPTVYA